MQQAQYISLIRKAMTRILVTDRLKICLLEAGMIFAVREAHDLRAVELTDWCCRFALHSKANISICGASTTTT